MKDIRNEQGGFILVAILISTLFVMFAGAATAQLATNNYRASTIEQFRVNAQFAVDAGAEAAMQELNNDHEWTGTESEVTLFDNDKIRTAYNTVVTDDTEDELRKHITVTGRTYEPSTNTTPRIERTYTVSVRAITAGSFSVVTGVGGLRMSNSAKIVGGNLFVNGEISMSNSAQIGLASSPIEVRVAHQSCPNPPDENYPQVCASGENGEPISIGHTAKIYGEVQATNQTNDDGMLLPGLVAGSPTPQALPSHDRAAQVAAVASEQTGSEASCSGSQSITWPANLKINGDVTLSNSCQITVEGDVWITGSLGLSNSSRLRVADGVSESPVVMIDSQNGLSVANNTRLASNSSNIGFRVITYWSAAGCSPDCADVTGEDLYNGRDTTTITLSNNAEGPNTEFYARWSRVQLSNGGNIGALVGQTVELVNSAAVTFGTEVSGVGGIVGWVIESYKRDF